MKGFGWIRLSFEISWQKNDVILQYVSPLSTRIFYSKLVNTVRNFDLNIFRKAPWCYWRDLCRDLDESVWHSRTADKKITWRFSRIPAQIRVLFLLRSAGAVQPTNGNNSNHCRGREQRKDIIHRRTFTIQAFESNRRHDNLCSFSDPVKILE